MTMSFDKHVNAK